MKKAIAIIFLFFYLGATTGVVITTHYCMGEVAGMALGHNDSDLCGTCGMDNMGCCHDDLSFHKIGDNHQQASVSMDIPEAQATLPVYTTIAHTGEIKRYSSLDYAGEPPSDIDLNIMHCVFRI